MEIFNFIENILELIIFICFIMALHKNNESYYNRLGLLLIVVELFRIREKK